MNARLMQPVEEPSISHDDLRHALGELLSSATFAKAPCMCRLLTFLLEKKLSGKAHEISEYAIGLDLFGRDANTYDASLDPQIRVQVGRLRSRLAARIAIPMGSYVPVISHASANHKPLRYKQIQLAPLRNLTSAGAGNASVCGLDEELGSCLLHALGKELRFSEAGEANEAPGLEGSVRMEDNHVRASIRLVEPGA
jgi:hypothetical protein